MTRYFLGIEDLSKTDRCEGSIQYRASLGYHGPLETEDVVKLIEPDGMTWLNGDPLQIGLRNKPIDEVPVVSNRPTEHDSDSLTLESLSYDSLQSRPHSEERIAVYHPINTDGLLEVLLHGEQRQIRVTLVAEYFERTGIIHDDIAEVVELNIPNGNQEAAIAA